MINCKNKFIFIHIPKTAGSSIKSQLISAGFYNSFNKKDINALNMHEHPSIEDCKNVLTPLEYKNFFKFTCVRNPWDLNISLFFYVKSQISHWLFRDAQNGFLNFLKKREQSGALHFNQIKINNNIEVDFVMRFENLQSDFNLVCDKINIARHKLPHKNFSKHKNYQNYYNEEGKDIIFRNYQEDIDRFEYKFSS